MLSLQQQSKWPFIGTHHRSLSDNLVWPDSVGQWEFLQASNSALWRTLEMTNWICSFLVFCHTKCLYCVSIDLDRFGLAAMEFSALLLQAARFYNDPLSLAIKLLEVNRQRTAFSRCGNAKEAWSITLELGFIRYSKVFSYQFWISIRKSGQLFKCLFCWGKNLFL